MLSKMLSKLKKIYQYLASKSKPVPPVPRKVFTDPGYFLAFGFGTGAIPIAPGTFGTLMAIPCYLLIQSLPLVAYLLFVISFIILSAWLSEMISKETNTHDHPGMNIDEFAGFFVTMIAAPKGWTWILLGFLLFRFFDVVKPWPIKLIDEKMDNGLGMILDDVAAGVFAFVILQTIAYLIGC